MVSGWKTLQPEQTKIGFSTVSDRLQMSHDLGCSLEKIDTDWTISEYFSDEILETAFLESASFALGCELVPALPPEAFRFNTFCKGDRVKFDSYSEARESSIEKKINENNLWLTGIFQAIFP